MNELQNRIIDGMMSFIEGDDDADYSPDDVKACGALLTSFASKVQSGISYDDAMKQVEVLVLKLNELNENCEFSLIETDQREDICEFIFQALNAANVAFEGDVTEEWREW